MKTPNSILSILMIVSIILSCNSCDAQSSHSPPQNDFLQCLSLHLPNKTGISSVVYTPNDASYLSILLSSVRSLRFRSASTPRPQVIVTPFEESQIQTTILCARENGMQIRIRSGGHDYEGLSYTSQVPFVVLDLFNFSEVAIDVDQKTAWVGAGAIIGQLYYRISQTSKTLAFPAGACPTVGVGGLFSGGGYGPMLRKFGLAADNIIDARIIDVNGRILDRKSMGEDLFWAIRGGGGSSFGVITAWKLKLVTVPETLTIFSVGRTIEQNATQLVHKWQYIAPNLDEDILLSISIGPVNSSGAAGGKTIQANFNSVYLGGVDKLLPLLEQSFPELGVRREDCTEVSWIQSALFFGGYSIQVSPEVVTSRNPEIRSTLPITRYYFKAKLDYVQEPISIKGFEGMWKLLLEREANMGELLVVPYGGKMKEISETALPFPHRAGNLYKIQQLAYWEESGAVASERSISWSRKLHDYMTPYVSISPRASYMNYRDLDLGVNNYNGGDGKTSTSYAQASVWGLKYFKNNFKRLVQIKTKVDPTNFFRNEQSIPSLYSKSSSKNN
ncbi:hypothetical protein ABFS82_13G050600 [Erythranthe guttata]|uniref:tetrahydrocannabinolic acid synthase-like n=1 Tax=Erythranthe guttata TaxID=4155 RepID=UPI00064DFD0F|nr:PREDICTED: tetrahydrocannabinolic acid synthase-like [Erythranthe guttata]|eukprot:XP_012832873.1 PREDICTED: tetrahydrocannabinolic acid synthase-like [Erythranthe guttata]